MNAATDFWDGRITLGPALCQPDGRLDVRCDADGCTARVGDQRWSTDNTIEVAVLDRGWETRGQKRWRHCADHKGQDPAFPPHDGTEREDVPGIDYVAIKDGAAVKWWEGPLPCPDCWGTGGIWTGGCTCGTSGFNAIHEPGCGLEPCPYGCAYVKDAAHPSYQEHAQTIPPGSMPAIEAALEPLPGAVVSGGDDGTGEQDTEAFTAVMDLNEANEGASA